MLGNVDTAPMAKHVAKTVYMSIDAGNMASGQKHASMRSVQWAVHVKRLLLGSSAGQASNHTSIAAIHRPLCVLGYVPLQLHDVETV